MHVASRGRGSQTRLVGPLVGAVAVAVLLQLTQPTALAHVTVSPQESAAGKDERYAIRVPSEKPLATTRVEVQFPSEAVVNQVEAVPGWSVTVQPGGGGTLVSATWAGGSIPSGQFVDFGVLGQNPDSGADLRWQVIQTYEDGSEVQWIGPPQSQFPAAITHVQRSGPSFDIAEGLAVLAVLLSLVAIFLTARGRRKSPRSTTETGG